MSDNPTEKHLDTLRQMLVPDYLQLQNALAPFANAGEVQPAILASTLRAEIMLAEGLVEIKDLLSTIAENTSKPKRGRPPKES